MLIVRNHFNRRPEVVGKIKEFEQKKVLITFTVYYV